MRFAVLLPLIFLAGCAAAQQSLPRGTQAPGPLLTTTYTYLDLEPAHSRRLAEFSLRFPAPKESQKIQFLIEAIQKSSFKFSRNGEVYSGAQAANWLRWKMHHRQYKNKPILSAQDFIERVCSISVATGQPYEVIYPDGKREHLVRVLRREFQALEDMLNHLQSSQSVEVVTSSDQAPSIPPPVTTPLLSSTN